MKKMLRIIVFLAMNCAFSLFSFASTTAFSNSVKSQILTHLLSNIATKSTDFSNNTIVGAMIAGTDTDNNTGYMATWARDTGITMNEVDELFKLAVASSDQANIDKYGQYMLNYINWLSTIDSNGIAPNNAKCTLDGQAVTSWGTPQNDGPAFASIALMNFANTLINNSVTINGKSYDKAYVTSTLYNPTGDSNHLGIIKYYLNTVSSNIGNNCFDLWETNNNSRHFFTQIVDEKSLMVGAGFADELGDSDTASSYLVTAKQYSDFSAFKKDFTYNNVDYGQCYFEGIGATDESSGMQLDSSILMGVLYSQFNSLENALLSNITDTTQKANLSFAQKHLPNLNSTDVVNTVSALVKVFKAEYVINANTADGVAALGRYPSDNYVGCSTGTLASPWFISTIALAQYYYLTDKSALGDSVMNLVASHWGSDSSMNEQFNRDTGIMCSYENLTWSYAMYLMTDRVKG